MNKNIIAIDNLYKWGKELKMSPYIIRIAEDTYLKAIKLNTKKQKNCIVAGALYISALINGEKRTQREVAEVTGVTEFSIRNNYKFLLDEDLILFR